MYRIIYIIGLILVYVSCEKENDPLKSISFENPNPPNGTTDVTIRNVRVRFEKITDGTYTQKSYKTKRIYLDTINPPIAIIGSPVDDNTFLIDYPILKPGKTYYWKYLVENIAGEMESEIQSFTTVSFDGNWKLESIAYADLVISDTLLLENNDIVEIQILGNLGKIKLYDSIDFTNTTFTYGEESGEIVFFEAQSGDEYSFNLFNVGYMKHYEDVVLILRNTKAYYIYYRH